MDEETSIVLMEAVRELIIRRKMQTYDKMLEKEDQENVRHFPLSRFQQRLKLTYRLPISFVPRCQKPVRSSACEQSPTLCH